MNRTKQAAKQDAYITNLLISLLTRFPEIMTIHFDMPHELAKFTFVIHDPLDKERYNRFKKTLSASLSMYQELTDDPFQVHVKLQRSKKMNLLILSSAINSLSLESIQLLCGIVCSSFPEAILRETESMEQIQEDELIRQEEIIDYLLNHSNGKRQENLLAFRESGKVMVYGK